MRVLLDTNIFILREDNNEIQENIQHLIRLLNQYKISSLVHPASKADIENDLQPKRKRIMLSKIQAYQFLEFPPSFDDDAEFQNKINSRDCDEIDNLILYAIYKDAVAFLITEDKGIKRKSYKLEIEEKVFNIDEMLSYLHKQYSPKKETTFDTVIDKIPIHNLDKNDPIFEHLREKYFDFNRWFSKISAEGREAYVYFKDQTNKKIIGAILILKNEKEPLIASPNLDKKQRIKIATLLVKHHGYKIGELFLKIAFSYAIDNEVAEIYLTHFVDSKEEDELLLLIGEYGFINKAIKSNGENIFIKTLAPKKQVIKEMSKRNFFYPLFFDGPSTKKFIVPIQPQFHKRLFPDHIENNQYQLFPRPLFIEGNTIKKAYLCHSHTKQIETGSILLFYRSHDIRSLTSLGVVDTIHYKLTDHVHIQKIVAKRTVYSANELKEISKKPTTVILFRWHFHFAEDLRYERLKRDRIIQGIPQQIVKLEHKKFLILKRVAKFNERLIIN